MKIPVALPATPSRPTWTTNGQAGSHTEFQQLIHKLEDGMWEGSRAGENRVDKTVAEQPSREARAAPSMPHAQHAPDSPRPTAPIPQRITTLPIGGAANVNAATPSPTGSDANRQRLGSAAEHAANTIALLGGWNTTAAISASTMPGTRAGAPADHVAPALPPAYESVPDGLVTVMRGINGLSVSVRFKESDTLRMSDIHRHILQAIKDHGMALDRLFINGNVASPATIKELNHGN